MQTCVDKIIQEEKNMKKDTIKDILVVAGCVLLIGGMAVLVYWLLSDVYGL